MNFIAYFSDLCMVSEEEQGCEQEQNRRWKGAHEWHHVRDDLGFFFHYVGRPCNEVIALQNILKFGRNEGHDNIPHELCVILRYT
jgi:hypothetical protein